MANERDTRTASQRIDDLERAAMSNFQFMQGASRDMMLFKEAVKLLGNKVDSIAEALVNGEKPTDEVVSKYMIARNLAELKGKVQNLIDQGILAPTDVVSETSFVVGSEQEADGKVIHARVQFTFGSLEKDLKDKLRGAKVGDIITFQSDKLRLAVSEIYNIVPPKAPEAAPAPAEAPAPTAGEEVKTFAPPSAPAPSDPAQSSSGAESAPAAPAAPATDQSGQGSGN